MRTLRARLESRAPPDPEIPNFLNHYDDHVVAPHVTVGSCLQVRHQGDDRICFEAAHDVFDREPFLPELV